ncbi:lysine/threonine exporter LysE/YggA [Acetobacter orientalis]|uniref:Lysine/threonine exporter LysE/YggA n=1 Tax=Acetobacter orientalis TaxID=146474 RepID=A0A2Z5ZKI6_9PROT|nr:lysine/threonine exporter LysE/YggA [Acetobacter orientalis]
MLGRAMVVVDLPLLLSFMLAAILLTITPGIDTVMMLRATTVGVLVAAYGPVWVLCWGCCCGGQWCLLG